METYLSAPHILKLRIFNIDAEIRSDSSEFIHSMSRMYQRFCVKETVSSNQALLEFILLTDSNNPWKKPGLIVDGKMWPSYSPELLEAYAHDAILREILLQVRSHFLIHAGAVAWKDQGVILAADMGHGKTTLVLELVRRGFMFLSDELAPIERGVHRIQPFPRSLRIRPGTLDLVSFQEKPAQGVLWQDKWLFDIEEIKPHSLSDSVPIQYVVILKDQLLPDLKEPVRAEREFGIFVERMEGDLIENIKNMDGVVKVWQAFEFGYPVIRIRASKMMDVLNQVEKLCQERGLLVLDVSKRPLIQPDFNKPAQMQPIPNSQAVIELLHQFQPGYKSALLQEEFEGSATRLFLELANTVQYAKCYQLSVGPLDQMADLICGLF